MRFESYEWNVQEVGGDGNDMAAFETALGLVENGKPTMIKLRTHIAYGSPHKQDSSEAHGAPLGDDEVALTRKQLGWNHAPFVIPSDIYAEWDAKEAGQAKESA
jgi:transketolase